MYVLFTWPLDLIRVSQVFRGRDKHLSIGDRRPKRNHVESAVVSNWGVFFWINYFTYRQMVTAVTRLVFVTVEFTVLCKCAHIV